MSVPIPAGSPTGDPAAPRRPRMGRYALWQLRDYVFERGLPTMIVAGLFGFLGAMPLRALQSPDFASRIPRSMILKHGSAAAAQQVMLDDASMLFLRQFLGAIVFLGALFAMNGLVSNDRKNGFYKFLFAKPLTPERYYGQAFVIHGVGFLVAILLLGQLWALFVAPVLSVDMIVAMWLIYLCYAGIAFFLTAAAKWDWLSLVVVAVASTELWKRFGESTSPFATLLYIFPPLTRTDSVYAAVTQRVPLPWNSLAWLGGYGIACFLAALVVLRHRRLATP